MAELLWGKVFYKDQYAGILKQEPGDCFVFEYDDFYLTQSLPSIAFSLPREVKTHRSHSGLPVFFDNLVAEGWLAQAQTRLLGQREASRFELLLAFGYDCAGAVSVLDPEPNAITDLLLDPDDPREMAALTSRASLSGVQPKLAVIERNGKYYPVKPKELSTHIAKFPSASHSDLVWNEYLTTMMLKKLLPDDQIVQMSLSIVQGQSEPALIIKRFDRSDGKRIHFEEFNQLLSLKSSEKYEGFYKDMSDFIRQNPVCFPVENYRLFKRILAGILLGNTDMHFKNFALFHQPEGSQDSLSLTPCYDMVSAGLYQYKTLALGIGGAKNLKIGELKPKNILKLIEEFNISKPLLQLVLNEFEQNKAAALQAVVDAISDLNLNSKADLKGLETLKELLITQVEKRWKSLFVSLGQTLSKKQ